MATGAPRAVIALTSPYLWYLSRASGVVSLGLLTIVMVLGVGTSTRAGGRILLRFEVAELHRRLSLLAVVFVAVHVSSTVLDSYVPTGPLAAVLPGASAYKTVPVAIGALGVDLLIALALTSMLRARIPAATWRAVHWLSYLFFPIAVLHTVLTGSDLKHRWMDVVVLACVGVVALAGLRRVAWHQRAVPEGARTVLHPHPRGQVVPAHREPAAGSKATEERRRVASARLADDGRRRIATTRRP